MPPFAGAGLSAGVLDADNASWKVALWWRGAAGAALLDTIEQERRPHVEAVTRLSTRLGRHVMTTSRFHAMIRDVATALARQWPHGCRYLTEMRFRPQPVVRNGAVVPGDPAVGSRLPEMRVVHADGRSGWMDDALGSGFAMLVGGPDAPEPRDCPLWPTLEPRLVQVGHCAPDGEFSCVLPEAPLPIGPDNACLIRPDRFIAAVFGLASEQRRWDELRQALHLT
jgi:3-(3-hydroxy-phenyl)propionate hydroxylase